MMNKIQVLLIDDLPTFALKKAKDTTLPDIKNHQKEFNNDNSNWGYIGDLEYVSNEIDKVVRFFNK